jgi:glycosyltransferase involved in cell wall biosynthesis
MMMGDLRVPHRLLGMAKTMALHDEKVARHLRKHASSYDVVHCWPGATLKTCTTANALGVPAVREVPNTHTRNAFEVVGALCDDLGIDLPPGHSHRLDPQKLLREEAEYEVAPKLLVPSQPVEASFLARGFPPEKLLRHQYGFDPARFFPSDEPRSAKFSAVFLGTVEPRKGLHIALRAWREAHAYQTARFSIYGNVVPGYRKVLDQFLAMPSVTMNDFTEDTAGVLRNADVLLLPSFEEGSALVTYEAQGCGVIPLVSEAAGAICVDGVSGFVHPTGDVASLRGHIEALLGDPARVVRARAEVLKGRDALTWNAAAKRLTACYEVAIADLKAAGSSR